MNVAEQQKPFGTLCRIVEKSNILSVFSCWTILFIHLSILNGCSCRVFELLIEQRQNGGSIWSTLWKVAAVWGGVERGWSSKTVWEFCFKPGQNTPPTPHITPSICSHSPLCSILIWDRQKTPAIFPEAFKLFKSVLFVDFKKLVTTN